MKKVPLSLRHWFLVHFIVDMLFAVPLFIAPTWLLTLFGFSAVDPLTARFVAAALFGIGGVSFFMHKGSLKEFLVMLKLKKIWSNFAVLALVLALFSGGPLSLWLILATFVGFAIVWEYYLRKFK
jgi:hypothetical protein